MNRDSLSSFIPSPSSFFSSFILPPSSFFVETAMYPHKNQQISLLTEPRSTFHERWYQGNAPTRLMASRTVADAEQFRFLVTRPVGRDDLAALMDIASHVNLASMRSARDKNQLTIEQSIRTLAGDLSWQQGLLFLATDLFPLDGGPCELAGNIKLQVGWG